MTENERFGLVFAKTDSINSGTVHPHTLTYGLLSGRGVLFICTYSKTMSSHDCTKCGKGTFTHPHTPHTSTHIQREAIVMKREMQNLQFK
jgi:hypothetical protein